MGIAAAVARLDRVYRSFGLVQKFLLLFVGIMAGQGTARLVPADVTFPTALRAVVVAVVLGVVLLGSTALVAVVRDATPAGTEQVLLDVTQEGDVEAVVDGTYEADPGDHHGRARHAGGYPERVGSDGHEPEHTDEGDRNALVPPDTVPPTGRYMIATKPTEGGGSRTVVERPRTLSWSERDGSRHSQHGWMNVFYSLYWVLLDVLIGFNIGES